MRVPRAEAGTVAAILLTAAVGAAVAGADHPRVRQEPHLGTVPTRLFVLRPGPDADGRLPDALREKGVAVVAHLDDGALLVARPIGAAARVPGLAAAEAWSPQRAIAPALARLDPAGARRLGGGVPIVVGLAPGSDLASAGRTLEAAGAALVWTEPAAAPPQLGLRVPASRLEEVRQVLRHLEGLAWADVQPPVRLRNAASSWRCQSGTPGRTPVFDNGLHGEGQVIGIMDTGIDIDHCQFVDPVHGLPALNDDVTTAVDPDNRKVLAVDFYWSRDWPNPGPLAWDDNGHGSHVAGSAAGDMGGDGRQEDSDGMAPAAKLVIQDGGAATDPCADLPGLGCPLRPLEPVLEQAFEQGARIHSDSWGDEEDSRPFNRYTERTADIDRFIWNHPDFLVLVAGGNDGPDLDTVGSPATGKNVVGVGATWHGDVDPPCVTDFSSRGWTRDGRVKPDVVVPGNVVVSAASDRAIDTYNCGVKQLSGTSMAAPTAAGLAALVRQYFTDGYYPDGWRLPAAGFVPSAALVKATLIASAVDVTTLGCSGIDPIPSRDQGWGLVELDQALHFPGDPERLWVDDHGEGFVSNLDAPQSSRLEVAASGPLKVVLVWTDPPSSSMAASNLVNDLDLEVEGPDGVFLGNAFSGGVSVTGGAPDRLNNVEVVWLPDASPGEWTLTVAAHHIAEGPQPFALVVTGAIAPPPAAPRRVAARKSPDR